MFRTRRGRGSHRRSERNRDARVTERNRMYTVQDFPLPTTEDLDFDDPPAFLTSKIEQVFWCLSARVREIIMEKYPRRVYFCFYKGVCTWSCEENPSRAIQIIRNHHHKHPHHFINPYYSSMQPWIKEMERRKLIRDEIRQKRTRSVAREEAGQKRGESVGSESSDTARTSASEAGDMRHKAPGSLKGVTYHYPEPRGSGKRSRSRDRRSKSMSTDSSKRRRTESPGMEGVYERGNFRDLRSRGNSITDSEMPQSQSCDKETNATQTNEKKMNFKMKIIRSPQNGKKSDKQNFSIRMLDCNNTDESEQEMGTCKYCDKSIPLANLKSHYKEHSMGSKTLEEVVTSKEDYNIPSSINEEDIASLNEDKNVQENCISSSSSPSDQIPFSDIQGYTEEDMRFQKEGSSFKISFQSVENFAGNNKNEETIPNSASDKSVASSSECLSEAENNVTMVIVKSELLELADSDVLNIKKEVDPLADVSEISVNLDADSSKVTIEQSNERLDRLSTDSKLELEIDISKEEITESISLFGTRSENRFAELSERNVKKFENLFNDYKEDESIKQKEEDDKNAAGKELTVEEAMEALHCEEPQKTPEPNFSEFSFKEPFCVKQNNIESGILEKAGEETDLLMEKSTFEKSGISNDDQNPQSNSDELNSSDNDTNLQNEPWGKESSSKLVLEEHKSNQKLKSPPDGIRELQKEDCSICQLCEVPFKPTVDITWNVVTLQLHFKCECGEQYCVSNISTKNIGSNQNLCN